jgi:DNA replication and repair protein RecF
LRRRTAEVPAAEAEDGIKTALGSELDKDIERGTTRFGPHRDDLLLTLHGRVLGDYGSEGECRLGSLAVKLAALQLLAQKRSQSDIVLLVDDVFGELDASRRERFLKHVAKSGQTVLTCTAVPPEMTRIGREFRIGGGAICGVGQ